jgi:hypothetical protein
VALLDPRRTENRDAFVNVAKRVKGTVDLLADAVEPALVVALLVDRDTQQALVVAASIAVASGSHERHFPCSSFRAYAQTDLLHTKSVISVCLACLFLGGLSGCGSGGEDTAPPQNPAKELAHWFQGVEAAVTRMEEKQRGFTRFRVSSPPARSGLVALSPAGAKAGDLGKRAADRLDAATALTAEEASGLYCYFFAFYVDLESSPDEKEFQMVILNLVKTRLSSPASPQEVRESALALREAMIAAEKAGGRAPEVAAAGFC